MQFLAKALILATTVAFSALAQAPSKDLLGRWGFNIETPGGVRAAWLGITEKDGALDIQYQPTGGNVIALKNFKAEGTKLTLTLAAPNGNRPGVTWELEAKGGQLVGAQKRGENSVALTGIRQAALKRAEPKAWTKPEPLFNGKDLTGWEPMGDPKNSHWTVQDGLVVNTEHGANLKSVRKFDDVKVHYEVLIPDHANSGFYLRGRYEVQIELEPLTSNPPERRIGSIYGRIAPSTELPRRPGEWETFDVTLVGRTVTVVRNGVTTIDHKEIEGITGGALDANESEPGPFYIQGDHTGGLKFRNVTVSVPKK